MSLLDCGMEEEYEYEEQDGLIPEVAVVVTLIDNNNNNNNNNGDGYNHDNEFHLSQEQEELV